ncbi:MAG: cytochrome c oxidase subunit 3 [Myxococcota bacterium]|nr:cytochrome c oxidase subunit 3 [Myxococcota bacterium]
MSSPDVPSGPPSGGHGPDDHGHGHHGSRFIAHHYDDAQHQFDSGKFGIWLFLAQEVLFFSALFVAYILYRHHHPEIYAYAHSYLDVKYGAINTGVLIFSSLTAAWAVRAAQLNQRKLLIGCLVATILCAFAFLGIKYIEYAHKVHEHILFGRYFDPCVSSGGRPLLTKNNNCSGHESTVVWDTTSARPTAGCFPDYAVDHDTRREGVQASCTVNEVTVKYVFSWVETEAGPETTSSPYGSLGACREAQQKKTDAFKADATKKRTVNPCVEQLSPPIRAITEQCPEWMPSSAGEPVKPKYPCWRPGFAPEVCRLGYSFTWMDGTTQRFGGPYPTEGDCKKDFKTKEGELKAAGGAPPAPCVRSHTVGVIVEYGDHEHRPSDLRITADCKGPPPPPPVEGDPLADTQQRAELGKAALSPYKRPTAHDAKEREAAGPPPEHTSMFFTIYFAMTGLHGIHVLFGIFVFIWLLVRAIKGHFTPDYFGPVDFAALYWHIVDLIWIFLFPLLYLIH